VTQFDLHHLIKAIKHGDVELMSSLINNGIDINDYNDQGLTPLCIAAVKGNTQVLKVLIDAGAEVNKLSLTGFAPLSFAVQANQTKAAAMLGAAGAKQEEHPLISSLKKTYPDIDFGPYSED
jgi:ankyrin repeat protein